MCVGGAEFVMAYAFRASTHHVRDEYSIATLLGFAGCGAVMGYAARILFWRKQFVNLQWRESRCFSFQEVATPQVVQKSTGGVAETVAGGHRFFTGKYFEPVPNCLQCASGGGFSPLPHRHRAN